MKLEFDFEKIKNSENATIKKNELNKFLNYYFDNGRPKNFIKYVDDLFKVSSKILQAYNLNELLTYIPNLYQFFYTITLNNYYLDSQKNICNYLLIPFSKVLLELLSQNNFKKITYKVEENHYLVICRHATTSGMYAPGTVIYSITSELIKKKKKVVLVSLGKVDSKFLALKKVNANFTILTPQKSTTSLKQLENLIHICKVLKPIKIITEMPVNIVTALYYINISSKILYWSPGFTEVPWYDKVMLIPELSNKKKLKEKRNILIPKSINFDLLNPKIDIEVINDFKNKYNFTNKNSILGTFARYEKITIKFLEIISYLLMENHHRKIILAGSNDNTDIKKFLKKFVHNKQAIILGESNVHILGHACDVFVDTIPFPCGSSALEMMAKGKPVIGIESKNLADYKKSRLQNLMVKNKFLLNDILTKLENNKNFYTKMSMDSISIARNWDNSSKLVKIIEKMNNF